MQIGLSEVSAHEDYEALESCIEQIQALHDFHAVMQNGTGHDQNARRACRASVRFFKWTMVPVFVFDRNLLKLRKTARGGSTTEHSKQFVFWLDNLARSLLPRFVLSLDQLEGNID